MNGGRTFRLESLTVPAGKFRLEHVSFGLPAGACGIVAGPSGSGKTVLIETVAGLRRPSTGAIYLGDRNLTLLDPAVRRIGYVPQEHALFPFLNVWDNVAFGLRARGWRKAEVEQSVREALSFLQIEHLADRWVTTLSGGERQRVAIARALATRPDLLLLDEPLNALDEETAAEIRFRLRSLRARFSITTLHVCHSVEEALELGERLLFLHNGRTIQEGTVADILDRPADLSVVRFFRLDTVLHGEIRETEPGKRHFWWKGRRIETEVPLGLAIGRATAFVPPLAVRLCRVEPRADPGHVILSAVRLPLPEALGRVRVRLDEGEEWTLPSFGGGEELPAGGKLWVVFARDSIRVMGSRLSYGVLPRATLNA